jgi:hypothetical protein
VVLAWIPFYLFIYKIKIKIKYNEFGICPGSPQQIGAGCDHNEAFL